MGSHPHATVGNHWGLPRPFGRTGLAVRQMETFGVAPLARYLLCSLALRRGDGWLHVPDLLDLFEKSSGGSPLLRVSLVRRYPRIVLGRHVETEERGGSGFIYRKKKNKPCPKSLIMATNKVNANMAKSDSRSSLNFLSDDSDIFDNAKENVILAADSPLRNPPTTSRRTLIKILKAFRTTSTHALQVLAGVLPLHLRAKELFANFLIKVQKTQVKFDDTYLDPELYEPTFNPYDQHPCEWFTFPFQKNQPSGDGIEIFTDGSKIGDRVGSAIACFYFGKLVFVDSHRLDDHSTVFQAEAYAFFMALNYIDLTNPWSKVSIYSDSLSLLSALASPKRKSWTLKQIADRIKAVNSHQRLSLHWVKAHIGVQGNKEADKQAKLGTEKDSIDTHVPRSHGTLKADIRRCILAEWQNEWARSSKGPQTRKYFPKVSTKMKSFHPFLIQFLSGHGRFPFYFNKFGITNDPLCDCGKVGTPDHYIYECIHTHLLRQKFINVHDKEHLLKDPRNIHIIHQIIAWINDHISRL
ncbi:Retrovirus-related Pol polyprotein type-1 like protein [Argiope bruennichi]|uniref:Retrovirus-related Pol polyprotein type-1 like protein n=1 Tax=Argiope bruennichi TaxID=94029 RepID=A0A8T0FHI3_ARGBR|nr:Retrovirus-related Pol polyprotein type-1 like protein [Argiope bruennichi]